MTQFFVGIDSGLSGALARLQVNDDGTESITTYATPVFWSRVGKTKRRIYDVAAMYALLKPASTLIVLERQQSMPAKLRNRPQGIASSFSTGLGFGLWLGLLTARGAPHLIVQAQRWRRLTGLGGADKAAVRLAVCRRFPGVNVPLDHADAMMLACAAALEHRGGRAPDAAAQASV
jgi:hypothetical protein